MIAASPARSLPAVLAEAGITLRRFTRGEHRSPCPQCAQAKRRRHDDALALKIDDRGATWVCHRCRWQGGVRTAAEPRRTLRRAPRPLEPPEMPASAPDPEAEQRRELAQETWRQTVDVRSCRPAVLYLASRGLLRSYSKRLIDIHCLGNLRAHPACPYKHGAAPALIAPVNDPGTGLVTAIWRILLKPTGEKIERRGLAPMKGCASRLFWPEGDELAIAEGVEDALAFHALTGLPAWAALSAGNMGELVLPDFIRRVVIAADNDPPDKDTGHTNLMNCRRTRAARESW